MKRGYMDWVKELLPETALEKRRADILSAALGNGFDAVIIYGDVYDADELSWWCNYAPYWCNSALILDRNGSKALVTGHNYRVNPWISELTGFAQEELIPAGPRVPVKVAEYMTGLRPDGGKIATISKYFPESIKKALEHKGFTVASMDAAAEQQIVRGDRSERALLKKAADILNSAIESGMSVYAKKKLNKKELCAEIEYAARKNGAMDIFIYTSDRDCKFRLALDGESADGAWNIYVIMQYLGVWVSRGLTVGVPDTSAELDALAALIKPGKRLTLKKDGFTVGIRSRTGADMVSSICVGHEVAEAGNIISVYMLDNSTGTYCEKNYYIGERGAAAL